MRREREREKKRVRQRCIKGEKRERRAARTSLIIEPNSAMTSRESFIIGVPIIEEGWKKMWVIASSRNFSRTFSFRSGWVDCWMWAMWKQVINWWNCSDTNNPKLYIYIILWYFNIVFDLHEAAMEVHVDFATLIIFFSASTKSDQLFVQAKHSIPALYPSIESAQFNESLASWTTFFSIYKLPERNIIVKTSTSVNTRTRKYASISTEATRRASWFCVADWCPKLDDTLNWSVPWLVVSRWVLAHGRMCLGFSQLFCQSPKTVTYHEMKQCGDLPRQRESWW